MFARTYRFYKDELGWFIDLKMWLLSRGYLAMVLGADVFLEKLAKGSDEVYLKISSRPFKDYDDVIIKKADLGFWKGAVYKPLINKLPDCGIGKNKLWLCGVTRFVFLRYPKKIYFKVVEKKLKPNNIDISKLDYTATLGVTPSTMFDNKKPNHQILNLSCRIGDGDGELVHVSIQTGNTVKTIKLTRIQAVEIGFINPYALDKFFRYYL